jgi:large subunit ribosomal protein L1
MAKKAKSEAKAETPAPAAEKNAATEEKKTAAEGKKKDRGVTPPAATSAPAAEAPAAPTAEAAPARRKRPGQSPPRGKKLREQLRSLKQQLVQQGPQPLPQAVALLKKIKRARFDETVEVHMSLGVDTTQSDQLVRGTVALPHGVGKPIRVVVFCQGENIPRAKEAGADAAGADDLIKRIQDGWLDFDVALATQDMMGKVSRLGKILGPRGLMPTPKAGTVITGDVAQAVREFKAGKVEYRTDKGGNVHAGVGKLSFPDDHLVANISAFVEQIRASRPAAVKGQYIKSITIKSTMSPGIPVTW